MNHALTIMDGFYPDPQALRARILASHFGDQIGPDGAKYTNISLHPEPELVPLVESAIGHRIVPKMQFTRVDLAGELPHCFCHSDEICATHASILYLNEPQQCTGGTAFWKHKRYGFDGNPRGVAIATLKELRADWNRFDEWEMCGFVGMKFNRFVTYPTSLFHSRWPQEAFGTTKFDGRICWICFYDVDSRYRVR